MLHTTFHPRSRFSTPSTMTYVLCWQGQPVFASTNHFEVYQVALNNGLAVNAWGCLFTLVPGATIDKYRTH